MTTSERELQELHQLRSWVFSKAKQWWSFGVASSYLAIAAVPFAWLAGWQEWAGPLAAVALAISGRVCVWRSEGYRKDAEWTIRTIELNRGIGVEVDTVRLADLKSRYIRALDDQDESVSDGGYYEVSGKPSRALLMMMERESAWWTAQLAKKASQTVFVAMCVFGLASVSVVALWGLEVQGGPTTSTTSQMVGRVYGLAICVVFLLDTHSLVLNYRRLSVAAKDSMLRLTALLERVDEVSDVGLMAAVSDYQSSRMDGPLIPDWFKRYHERTLQRVWGETLSKIGE